VGTVLHREGDNFAIVTDAENEPAFREQFSGAISKMIEDGTYDAEEWEFSLARWLAPATEISCKYRGYKSDVVEKRTIIAGSIDPDAAVISFGRETAVAA
jgi:hypothetical protein